MNFELDDDYIEHLEEDLLAGKVAEHSDELAEMHPADIAEIVENLSLDAAKALIFDLEEEKSAEVLIELDEDQRADILEDYTGKEIATELISNLDSDDAADLINELSPDRKREVLHLIEDPEQARDIADLMIYPENTAGALMGTELIKVNHNWSVLQCVKEMRKQAEQVDQVHSIYVVDDQNRLLGTLSLKKLLTTSTRTPISEVYNKSIQSAEATEDGASVGNTMQKYDLVVMPVVNALGELLGRITIDDVLDLIREEAKEDYNLASGLTDEVESDDNVMTVTRARLPWLVIGLFGGMLAASVIGRYEDIIGELPKMAFFIPLIAAMGGNVGVQSSAIVVQALAGKALMGSVGQRLIKEVLVALVNGLICSALIIGAGLLLGYGTNLSLTVALALLTVILAAALIGTSVPIILDKYNIDPALATGPFITTMNDIIGLFIYFTMGHLILGV
jgi:magnesium transporter